MQATGLANYQRIEVPFTRDDLQHYRSDVSRAVLLIATYGAVTVPRYTILILLGCNLPITRGFSIRLFRFICIIVQTHR